MPNRSRDSGESRVPCYVCLQIARAFATALSDECFVTLGSTEQALSGCSVHFTFLFQFTGLTWREDGLNKKEISLLKPKNTTYLRVFLNDSVFPPLELVKNETVPNHVGLGRILDANWIDHTTLRCWYERCRQNHGRECDAPRYMQGLAPAKPSLFVDTWINCLVPAPPGVSYIALSYVWGRVESFKTEKSMLPELQLPNSLSRKHISQHIPTTIIDAIRITSMLGERYLWVDSLCIIQDDEDSRQGQLNQMCAIYAHASITLVAADGADCQYGLRGLKGITQPRKLEQEVIPFGDGDHCVEHVFPLDCDSSAPYYSRGWTFQEQIFSKRRIYFEKESVRWECSCSRWYEDLVFGDRLDRSNVRVWQTSFAKFYPCLQSYSELVRELSNLHFTYKEDVLQACAGMTSALSRNFVGGFVSGLPELFFDIALLWQPWNVGSRRTHSRRPDTDQATSALPSWSWAGWDSQIDPWSWQPGCEYLASRVSTITTQTTLSTTTWYTADVPNPSSSRRIGSDWDKYKSLSQNSQKSLPAGWSRQVCPKEIASDPTEHGIPVGCGSYYFIHELDRQRKFWYPIPIASPEDEPLVRSPTRFLFGKCQIAFFFFDRSLADTYHPCISIRSLSGAWVGILRLQYATDITLFKHGQPERVCELVAISRGHASNSPICNETGLDEWNLQERPKSAPLYEYYNVLWVERKDGIVFRRALGRVIKDAWESQNPKYSSLIFGRSMDLCCKL
ncbi:heterokaryon incompatibility protein-domain-containing protein [Paraphoma chrysanthemicola]|nr:heterokaryon incompatibility protein-domain-containing protein [Paraphoma chrysanthemicola]